MQGKQNKIYIYGKHAVEEALRNAPHLVRKIFIAPQMEDNKLRNLVHKSGITVEPLNERRVTSQVEGNQPHQGIVALISLTDLVIPFEKFFKTFKATPETALLFLSDVQDPQNVGALIRSAVAFGATAVLMPMHKHGTMTGGAVKASTGMAFQIPLVEVDNVQHALSLLKKEGVRIYGMAGEAKNPITTEPFASPTMFVLGNEGTGIASSAKLLCDRFISIPMDPNCESLNVAVSGAVALYAWNLKHPGVLKNK